jgi:hypothetical protein
MGFRKGTPHLLNTTRHSNFGAQKINEEGTHNGACGQNMSSRSSLSFSRLTWNVEQAVKPYELDHESRTGGNLLDHNRPTKDNGERCIRAGYAAGTV